MVHLRGKRYHSGQSQYRAHCLAPSFLLMEGSPTLKADKWDTGWTLVALTSWLGTSLMIDFPTL